MHQKDIYLFVIVTCCCQWIAQSTVITWHPPNMTEEFGDFGSDFGRDVESDGIQGFLVVTEPSVYGCGTLKKAPVVNGSNFIALIRRGDGCNFANKVLSAQQANYSAAIVYNDVSNQLERMSCSGDICSSIMIPSVFVGFTSGLTLLQYYTYKPGVPTSQQPYAVIFPNEYPPSLQYYLIPFCTVLGTIFTCLSLYGLAKCIRNRRRRRRNRLSRQRLKQLPVKQFSKGDEYDVCAICLDDYEEGEKLRILPCNHAYHCKCIDPWLTSSKRVCPLCKRRVLSDDESSNSDSDYDDTSSEEAPLLQHSEAASPNAPRFATGFSSQNPFTRSYSSSVESSAPREASVSVTTKVPLPREASQESNPVEIAHSSRATPEVFSTPRSTPLVVVADVPLNEDVATSTGTLGSLEAYSCKSGGGDSMKEFEANETQVLVLQSGSANPVSGAANDEPTVS